MASGTSGIEHEIRVAASPEIVFRHFTDPVRLVRWMGREATLDPRPGGIFRLVFQLTPEAAEVAAAGAAAGARVRSNVVLGEFVEIEPHTLIVFTWGYERELFAMPPQSTVVEVSLTPDGDETVVRLEHRELPGASAEFHRAGWDHYLPRLASAASGRDPGRDPLERAA